MRNIDPGENGIERSVKAKAIKVENVDTLFENSSVMEDNVVEFLSFLLLNVSAAHLMLIVSNRLIGQPWFPTIRGVINGRPRSSRWSIGVEIYDLGS